LKSKKKLMDLSTLEYFDFLDDEILVEMAQSYPLELKRMCNLITLDSQLEDERQKNHHGSFVDEFDPTIIN
tara:strand:- start:129 stop:341 length:213 start_codon:yes stop_codon:yes gene_type:complete